MEGPLGRLQARANEAHTSIQHSAGGCESASTALGAVAGMSVTAKEQIDSAVGTVQAIRDGGNDSIGGAQTRLNFAADEARRASRLVPNGELASRSAALGDRCTELAGKLALDTVIEEALQALQHAAAKVDELQQTLQPVSQEAEEIAGQALDIAGGTTSI